MTMGLSLLRIGSVYQSEGEAAQRNRAEGGAPEVLKTMRVNVALHVALRMVNHVVNVLVVQAIVRWKRVR
jgi:hypothetical protein